MKFIGLTMRMDLHALINERRDSIDQRWFSFINACGFRALLLPNNGTSLELIKDLHGVVFTGGNSLSSFGGNAPERDELEYHILDFSVRSGLPIIGVCRGMQIIQSYFGAKIKPINNHEKTRHLITFGKKEFTVNSYHSFGAFCSNDDLKTLAVSTDGVIEAIKHKNLNIKGIMWHPEREEIFSQFDLKLFRNHFST